MIRRILDLIEQHAATIPLDKHTTEIYYMKCETAAILVACGHLTETEAVHYVTM